MFAVPGWSLAAAPTTQVDTSAPKKKREKKKKGTTGGNTIAIPQAKKRVLGSTDPDADADSDASDGEGDVKKSGPVDTTVVTAENVLGLYEKVIEGKPSNADKKRKRERERKKEVAKRAKKGKFEAAAAEGEEGAEVVKPKTLKEKRREKKAAVEAGDSNSEDKPAAAPIVPAAVDTSALTPLQQKMRAKLSSARFRHINETLYTTPSASSHALFAAQPEMYAEYHTGFRQQVGVWPENPVDIFIAQLQTRGTIGFAKGHSKRHLPSSTAALPLPRDQETGVCVVADLGCGDAKIAATFNHGKGKVKKGKDGKGKGAQIKVLSYDLQASTPDVTVADIASLPLAPESVDVVIFCLALMGTNFLSFIDEAHRILRWRGELWVAEIKSRFNRPSAGTIKVGATKAKKAAEEEAEMEDELVEGEAERKRNAAVYANFVDALKKRGFSLRGQVDDGNRMFVRMEFVKMPERERRMQEEEEEEEAAKEKGMGGKKMGGRGGEKDRMMKKKGLKFLDSGELKEGDILKPCVYKLR
ncbi:methyltransferase-domain-containing protein [Geopyxis carbonaria]|nr:methyltransferase-domain-containing protein [Geopyxis carbonaria]